MQLLSDLYLNLLGGIEVMDNARLALGERLLGHRARVPGCQDANLSGKVVLITGGNSGIGFSTAEELTRRGAHVILGCRSLERGKQAAQRLGRLEPYPGCKPGSAEVRQLDLASLDSVRALARQFDSGNEPLDCLICNAGIMAPPERLETADGLELQFQTNYLSHWLLARGLLESYQRKHAARAAQKKPRPQGKESDDADEAMRVVILSSLVHFGGRLDFSDLQARVGHHPFRQYAATKMANLLAVKELHRRYGRSATDDGFKVTAVACHPGIVDTFLARNYFRNAAPRLLRPALYPLMDSLLFPWFLRSTEAAADTVLFALTAPAMQVAGKYVADAGVARHSSMADDEELSARLWRESEFLTASASAASY